MVNGIVEHLRLWGLANLELNVLAAKISRSDEIVAWLGRRGAGSRDMSKSEANTGVDPMSTRNIAQNKKPRPQIETGA